MTSPEFAPNLGAREPEPTPKSVEQDETWVIESENVLKFVISMPKLLHTCDSSLDKLQSYEMKIDNHVSKESTSKWRVLQYILY